MVSRPSDEHSQASATSAYASPTITGHSFIRDSAYAGYCGFCNLPRENSRHAGFEVTDSWRISAAQALSDVIHDRSEERSDTNNRVDQIRTQILHHVLTCASYEQMASRIVGEML